MKPEVIIRRTGAIGDALAASAVGDKLVEMGYSITFQAHPDIHCVLRRQPKIAQVEPPHRKPMIDLDGAYERDPKRGMRHFHDMFFATAQAQVDPSGMKLGPPTNCTPRLIVPTHVREKWINAFNQYPRPWVLICPRSNAWNVRDVPDPIWQEAARYIKGTCFWIGKTPAPNGIVDLQARHLDNVIEWTAAADVLVTVDTGPMHIAAALNTPVVAIEQSSSPQLHLSDQNDYISICPPLDCLNCQLLSCPVDLKFPPCQNMNPLLIATMVNAKTMAKGGVSCVISIYRPDGAVLNRCLQQILPQVDEIVVVKDEAGILPPEVIKDSKIIFITKAEYDIGYGRKCNYGARHTNGEWLLFLNDDCFLEPDAVQKMKECVQPDTGGVAPLLYYPDGTIYHAGKVRSPRVRGWGHINHRQKDHTFKDVTELENLCGCCMLVRRSAFYQAKCYDEDFYLYAEDDALCLAIRRAGWKLLFTPHARGIHMEHQSTWKTNGISSIVQKSNELFGRKFGAYFDWNATRIPGNFDYLKT